jgi:hypothetical protein
MGRLSSILEQMIDSAYHIPLIPHSPAKQDKATRLLKLSLFSERQICPRQTKYPQNALN